VSAGVAVNEEVVVIGPRSGMEAPPPEAMQWPNHNLPALVIHLIRPRVSSTVNLTRRAGAGELRSDEIAAGRNSVAYGVTGCAGAGGAEERNGRGLWPGARSHRGGFFGFGGGCRVRRFPGQAAVARGRAGGGDPRGGCDAALGRGQGQPVFP